MAITTLNNRSINRSDTASAYQFWTATSATASYFQAAGGKVLQCVSTTVTSQASSNSTSYVAATGMSVSITPSATSSKVLVTFDNAGRCDNSAAASILTIYRDATNIGNGDNGMCHIKNDDDIRASSSGAILDSPSSTSAITYAVYHRVSDVNGNSYIAYDGASSTITAIEIGA